MKIISIIIIFEVAIFYIIVHPQHKIKIASKRRKTAPKETGAKKIKFF